MIRNLKRELLLYWVVDIGGCIGGYIRSSRDNIGIKHGHIGIKENKMETTIIYWGYIGVMARKWNLLY